mgnify:CR=1 FL=1
MNILFLFFGSLIISLSIDTIGELSFLKDFAHKGYKTNMNKLFDIINKNDGKFHNLFLFIPGINIVNSLLRMRMLKNIKKELLLNLNDNDLFIKMTEGEYQSFMENPKSVNALNLSFDYVLKNIECESLNKPTGTIKISNGNYRQDNIDGTFNDIDYKKEEDKIVITALSGEISSLSEEKRIEALNKIFKPLYKKSIVIDEKLDTTLKKELLIAHREDVLKELLDNEHKLILK